MGTVFHIPTSALKIGEKVFIRKPQLSDKQEFVRNIVRSQAFHYPWVINRVNQSFFTGYLLRFDNGSEGHLVCCKSSGKILGVININDIARGALQSGYLGFYAFVQYAGKGYMSEGLKLVIERAFNDLGLHRLEANIQPGNMPSKNFVKRQGFKQEGFSRRYLKIGGKWKDHERWALLREDWLNHAQDSD